MPRKTVFLLIIIFITACNRDRVSQFDIQAENFYGPTAVNTTVGRPVYDPGNVLIGVQVVFVFCDPFPKSLGLTHLLYEGGFAVDSAGFVFPANTTQYSVYVYSPSGIPPGSYAVKCFFGDWPVAGFPFNVVSKGTGTEFRAESRLMPDTLPSEPERILRPR